MKVSGIENPAVYCSAKNIGGGGGRLGRVCSAKEEKSNLQVKYNEDTFKRLSATTM